MKDPKIKTKVVHSKTKSAWNVVGTSVGLKYKIARIPYEVCDDLEATNIWAQQAFEHAEFISHCFNNSEKIINHHP